MLINYIMLNPSTHVTHGDCATGQRVNPTLPKMNTTLYNTRGQDYCDDDVR